MATKPHELRPGIDDVQRTDESGEVDLSLIEDNLSLTPAERIEQNDRFAELVRALREAGERHYGNKP